MDGFLLPLFSVTQDEDNVIAEIVCPKAIKGDSPSVAVEECIFGFRLDPYYLPLVFPHPVLDAVTEAVTAGQWRVVLRKTRPGQEYADLDHLKPCLLPEEQLRQAEADAADGKGFFQDAGSASGVGPNSQMLAPGSSDQQDARKLLQQAMSSRGLVHMNDDDGEAKLDVASHTQPAPPDTTATSSYGFGLHNAIFGSLVPPGANDSLGLLEVQDPGSVHSRSRLQTAIAYEEEHWDEGVYMENFLDQEGEIAHLLGYSPQVPPKCSPHELTEGQSSNAETLCVLVQLLFALCYDDRTNDGEPTVESGWNIAKLCRSLVASVDIDGEMSLRANLTATLNGCARRSLTVPLYRQWQLINHCLYIDTVACLSAGRSYVAERLSEVQRRLDQKQDAVLSRLAQIWVTPLLNDLPDDTILQTTAQTIQDIIDSGELTKESVGGDTWDLEVLELAAQQALEAGEGGFV